jgi:hypothetical protein
MSIEDNKVIKSINNTKDIKHSENRKSRTITPSSEIMSCDSPKSVENMAIDLVDDDSDIELDLDLQSSLFPSDPNAMDIIRHKCLNYNCRAFYTGPRCDQCTQDDSIERALEDLVRRTPSAERERKRKRADTRVEVKLNIPALVGIAGWNEADEKAGHKPGKR